MIDVRMTKERFLWMLVRRGEFQLAHAYAVYMHLRSLDGY